MSTNGQVNLEALADYSNAALPAAWEPRGLIGPFWDDLYVAGTTDVMVHATQGAAGARVFIAEWYRASWLHDSAAELIFQLRLYEADGHLEYVYGPLMPNGTDSPSRRDAAGGSATVGLQSYERDSGVTCGFNNAGVTLSGSWLAFFPR